MQEQHPLNVNLLIAALVASALWLGMVQPIEADVSKPAAPPAESTLDRTTAVAQIIELWSPQGESQARQFAASVIGANDAQLHALIDASTEDDVLRLLGATPQGSEALLHALALGDTESDLVYSPVEPCRIVNTQMSGGALGAGASRQFYVYGDALTIGFQGGNALTGCPAPKGEPSAVHLVVTAVPENAGGNLRVYSAGMATPNASVVNYKPGVNIADAVTVKTTVHPSNEEVEVFSSTGAHVVMDVMGYYYPATGASDADFSTSTVLLVSGDGCTHYSGAEVTVVAPGPGKIRIDAQAWLQLTSHTQGTADRVYVEIGTTTDECPFGLSSDGYHAMAWSVSDGEPSWAGVKDFTVPVSRTISVSSAGSYTFYLNGNRTSGASDMRFWYASMQGLFIPPNE